MIWRNLKAGISAHWQVTPSLVGVLGSPLAALAQAGRPWVDPPPESDTKTQAPVSVPSALPATPPAQAAGPNSAPSPVSYPTEAKATDSQSADETASQKSATDDQTKQKPVVERKTRASSQQTSSSGRQRREGQVVRRRATGTQVSQAQPRSAIERRARVMRYGSVQEGLDAGLQVMRLRTIQLPDGRRIDVLTRPDQDIASGLPDGY